MDIVAPAPSERPDPVVVPIMAAPTKNGVSVTLVGTGGCGINIVRPIKVLDLPITTLYFDTSMANTRSGESANIIGGGGSGSLRSENARDIEREIPGITDEELALGDVAILVFSSAGGSGSVISPLLAREYKRRGTLVIGLCVIDTSSTAEAKNALGTLKTLNALTTKNDICMPTIFLSNDKTSSRKAVDDAAHSLLLDLIDILTKPVYEIDKQDRLRWIDPTKVASTSPGVKILSFVSARSPAPATVQVGVNSKEMVDSLLIIQASPSDDLGSYQLPQSRLRKTGYGSSENFPIIGKVSSDISELDSIIDAVESKQHADRTQKHKPVERLHDASGDDIIF